jgi:hypothetical protein
MGSKKGRHNQSWVSTPFGCYCLVILHQTYAKHRQTMRGDQLKHAVVAEFERLVPYHQKHWDQPRTADSIFGRGMTTNLEHKGENVFENPRTQPFVPMALRTIERGEPRAEDELMETLSRHKLACPGRAVKNPLDGFLPEQSCVPVALLDKEYLTRLPKDLPTGRVLVHNSVRPTRRLGSRGFRAWLDNPDGKYEPCPCSWAPELGVHYRVAARWHNERKSPVEPELAAE